MPIHGCQFVNQRTGYGPIGLSVPAPRRERAGKFTREAFSATDTLNSTMFVFVLPTFRGVEGCLRERCAVQCSSAKQRVNNALEAWLSRIESEGPESRVLQGARELVRQPAI